MDIISRGFSGRRSAADVKLPAGQYLTTDFPVLSAGPTPHVSLERWEFVTDDGTNGLRDGTGRRFAICLQRPLWLTCTASRDGRN
jgi:hypothetical protein